MVMKFKGVEHKASVLKLIMDDKAHDMLDFITKAYKLPSNKHTVVALIADKFAETIKLLEAQKAEKPDESN